MEMGFCIQEGPVLGTSTILVSPDSAVPGISVSPLEISATCGHLHMVCILNISYHMVETLSYSLQQQHNKEHLILITDLSYFIERLNFISVIYHFLYSVGAEMKHDKS
jgi:hypothetical protein